jgi:decarbamoylnovobiocin carbamoyltransferase/7-O-carbamoyltransferase
MLVLGLSGGFSPQDTELVPGLPDWFFHDAAACLVRDGVLLAAVEEERLNRIKKTNKFPEQAIRACLDAAGVAPSEIDAVGHYFRRDFVDQALNEFYAGQPAAPLRYSRELITDRLSRQLGIRVPAERLLDFPHHFTHAMSCFVRSGLPEALVLVLDGQGEEHSGTVYRATRERIETLATYDVSKSLGALYEYAIGLLGYRFGDEYKVMGLAPYGDPRVFAEVFESLYTLGEKGDYEIHPQTLVAHPVASMFLERGFPPRRKGEAFSQRHKDFAAGLQRMLETIVLHLLTHWARQTGLPDLCFVGGVAHNSTLNGLILKSGLFRSVFIHPASHDAGAAEGAALAAADRLGENRPLQPRMRHAGYGPTLGDAAAVRAELAAWDGLITYAPAADPVEVGARLLAQGEVLGWARGASEFGPRALGNRSILADARPAANKTRINAMVKKREGYRPFAPVVTAEAAADYFDLPDTRAHYDFMSYVVDVRADRRAELGAVTHVDGSARLQIVEAGTNAPFHRLVARFGELTGTPVLLNTSFNNNAEPIVQSVRDAVVCFLTTGLDALMVEDFLVRRRPEDECRWSELVPRLRPVTRLSRTVAPGPDHAPRTAHAIALDYSTGPGAAVSERMFQLLSEADGRRSLGLLCQRLGQDLDRELLEELRALWSARFFTLDPPTRPAEES